jgi:glycosyltransferase involved in cell wall biosynthesis
MVTTFYPPYHFGGDAMYVYRLTNALARRGHRVTVVHSVDAYRLFGKAPASGRYPHEPGVTVRPIRSVVGPLAPLVTYLSGRPGWISSALDDVFATDFDVVHFHNISLVGGPGVLSYGGGTKLYTLNEHWLVCPMHVLWKNNREPCVEPACIRCTLTFHRPPQLWRYTSLLERQLDEIDLFLSPSRFTREAHHERGFTRPIQVLPYFLPEHDAAPASDGRVERPDRPYFLFVGRLERLKGLAPLIECFRSYPHADLVVAGDGTLAQDLRRQARGLANVRFVGRVHPDDLRALYRDAVAVIVPSIGYEVFGIVTLEAFAQRTPVIVHDLGALPEPVLESGGGYVYRTDSELLEAMDVLRRDAAVRRDLGDRGHRAWLERWSEEPHLTQYLELLEAA